VRFLTEIIPHLFLNDHFLVPQTCQREWVLNAVLAKRLKKYNGPALDRISEEWLMLGGSGKVNLPTLKPTFVVS
jgi:hypothetical protein